MIDNKENCKVNSLHHSVAVLSVHKYKLLGVSSKNYHLPKKTRVFQMPQTFVALADLTVQFQKKFIPTPWKITGNSLGDGGGDLKSKNFRSKV